MKREVSILSHSQQRCGSWRLPLGKALSLQPRSVSLLVISLGRAWVTMNAVCDVTMPDWVLSPNDTLWIPANRHVVVESWPRWAGDELFFNWDPAPPPAPTGLPMQ